MIKSKSRYGFSWLAHFTTDELLPLFDCACTGANAYAIESMKSAIRSFSFIREIYEKRRSSFEIVTNNQSPLCVCGFRCLSPRADPPSGSPLLNGVSQVKVNLHFLVLIDFNVLFHNE